MKISASSDLQNVKTLDDLKRFVTIFCGQVSDAFQGKISVTDNIRDQIISVTFAVPATTYAIPHRLNATPVGYIVVSSDSPLSLYDGTSPNTKDTIFLQSSAAGVAKVMVLA